jgi:superfamily II DNA or RNA helicase
MSALGLTPEILNRILPADHVARGKEYAESDCVSDLEYFPHEHRYAAKVQGTAPQPYRVEARLMTRATGVVVYGLCTCPMRVNCKHVAAMLWKVMETPARKMAAATVPKVEPAGWKMPPGSTSSWESPAPKTKPASSPNARQSAPRDLPFELSAWLESAQRVKQVGDTRTKTTADSPQTFLYMLNQGSGSMSSGPVLSFSVARKLKSGVYGRPATWKNVRAAISAPPRFVTEEDQRIFRMLMLDSRESMGGEFILQGEAGTNVLRAVLATGRCHLGGTPPLPLAEGPSRVGKVTWTIADSGAQRVLFEADPAADFILPLTPPWYVDTEEGHCGVLETGMSAALVELLVKAPEVAPEHAAITRDAIAAVPDAADIPLPVVPEFVDRRDVVPVPHLRLRTLEMFEGFYGRNRWSSEFLDVAVLEFEYDGARAGRDSPGLLTSFKDGKVVRIKRDHAAEKRAHAALAASGFVKVSSASPFYPDPHKHDYTLTDEQAWLDFMVNGSASLRGQGWQIDCDESFRFATVDAGDWRAEVNESGQDWFDLSLQVDVEGGRVDLIPLLLTVIRERPELLNRKLPGTPAGHLFIRLDDGRLLPVPFARLQPLVAVLHDLLDTAPSGKLRLPRVDALRLADLNETKALIWKGGEALRALGQKMAEFKSIAPVAPPADFNADLRPYQAHGLAWLQFLREYGLGGILADDMGLGKTVQTLAHILVEKQAGRLKQPVLVVAPTSVVPNWKAEAARFTPQLRVHVSHGLKRKEAFGAIADSDIVLTTYSLLPRDEETLLAQEFHLVILDEAQQIKNAQTQAARVVGKLRANHRLCLTGTPLENHLGELWSLFHFLMPGLLGDAATFRRAYRTPIEKRSDDARREQLVRRIRPFLLRRTKDQVAKELPPKSEILRPVELAGAQRDLYETVRASMHERVRAEIAARGLAQSHIIVLDALLKLRQICCDPRLLKIDAAKHVKDSAKLQLLVEMLQELLPEGRRVLIFSQFTSMLDLIEPELAKLGADFVKLTGQTRDREKPVKLFQSGKVPLFLISLKAGGTGLNLTAADTVIHYDPWWNPAVENQATGRAHRIGQDKPVFVYKLIVSGSVEEKIAALQASKAALARGVLENDAGASLPLTAEDIQALFEPLR